MVTGWRRAFCTSIPKDRQPKVATEKQNTNNNNNNSPKPTSKFGFFSNPSTPRLQSQAVSSPSLRCRTASATAVATPEPSVPNSPKLQCKSKSSTPKKNNSPRLFNLSSSPSSPRSPSSFSLLKSTLRLSKSKCGICLQSVKTGQGTAIFTAECSHTFHFPCVATHVHKHQILLCPICNTVWKDLPIISLHNTKSQQQNTNTTTTANNNNKTLRVYNDDEPLMSPTPGFNPIPETDENEETTNEFQGFFVNNPLALNNSSNSHPNIDINLLPEAALLASTRNYNTYTVVLKLRAPSYTGACRPPLDLVTLIDLNITKVEMLKQAMRIIISSLGSKDRLSIVAFSASSKRLLPLRRMTATGRRAARRIVETLVCNNGKETMTVQDALKKAVKVLQDRRERNSFSTIMILSDGQNHKSSSAWSNELEVPIHAVRVEDLAGSNPVFGGLLSVVAQDLRLQLGFMSGSGPVEISGVYSLSGRVVMHGPGLVRLGDLYAEEERELLVEIKSLSGSHHVVLSVQSSYVDPSTKELVYSKEQGLMVPRPQTVRSCSVPGVERLKALHVATRGIAESRRLIERNDFSGAQHLLSSARALLLKSNFKAADELLRRLEAELAEVQRRKQAVLVSQRQRVSGRAVEEKAEPLTPTSAWRAAERLAKLAVMRKSMNRVSDLHGFEDARF